MLTDKKKFVEARELFKESGYAVLKKVLTSKQVNNINTSILLNINKCIQELNCRPEDYLQNVSRWLHPSPVTESADLIASTDLKKVCTNFIDDEVTLKELNVISKSKHSVSAIPCHQDLSYTPDNPYHFSMWVALKDISLQDGVLEFLPGSHLGDIEPAVDFWQPDFVDKMYLSDRWQTNFVSQPIEKGDAIVFDSRIWHRSAAFKTNTIRFALVTRWFQENFHSKITIPKRRQAYFGMWNCGEITINLLRKGLIYCYQQSTSDDISTVINQWIENLCQEAPLPFSIDKLKAKNSLCALSILHNATHLHNGGDGQGIVYANLWRTFLQPLSEWLSREKLYEYC